MTDWFPGILFVAFVVLTLGGVLYVFFNPRIKNKAGPDWIWRGGKRDPFRNLIYREDGSFRKRSLGGMAS